MEKDLNSMMRHEFRLCMRIAILEGEESEGQVCASDSNSGHQVGQVRMQGTPQLTRSERRRFQAARRMGVSACAAEHEHWARSRSRDQPLRLIPVGDVERYPESSNSYVEAPEEGGITYVSNENLDKVVREALASNY